MLAGGVLVRIILSSGQNSTRQAKKSQKPANVLEGVNLIGTRLLTRALFVAAEKQLSHAPTRLLMYMAFRALDDDRAPVSYIGRDLAAEVLGNRGTPEQRYDAVRKATTALKRAGVISLRNKPHEGRRAEYLLHLPERLAESSPLYVSEVGRESRRDRPSRPEEVGPDGPPKDKEKTKEEARPTSPNCKQHPQGTSESCGACARARRAYEAAIPGNVITVMPGSNCGEGRHRLVADGTCALCEWRAA